jgi:hypothetical protein
MVVGINTMDEMESLYYGGFSRSLVAKANTPMATSEGGAFNAVYGAYAWAQLNLEANAWGILPKYPWDKSGWRAITARPTITGDDINGNSTGTTYGGIAEGGVIPETVIPSIAEIDIRPKTMALTFSTSEVMEWLANHSKDDIWGGLGSLRLYMAVQHKELVNQALLADVEGQAAGAGAAYAGTNDIESLDRIISSNAEETALGGAQTDWYDPWKGTTSAIDRDSSSLYDSTVESAGGAIGTNGVLTDDVLRTHLRSIRKASGKDPNVFLGSHEVYTEIQGIYTPQVRVANPYGEKLVQVDVNGIKTFEGTGVGLHVNTLYGIPFVPTKDAPSYATDTDEVGRLFALDTSDAEGFGYPRLGIQVAVPTEYYEATRRTPGYPFINNNTLVERGLFRTMMEVSCRHFVSQGKIRDIRL